MTRKEFTKRIKRSFAWWALFICSLIIKGLPERFLYSFARFAASLGYYIVGKRRKLALESLNIAFKNGLTPQQQERIAKDCFYFMAKGGLELLYFMGHPHLIRQRVSFQGKENLDVCLSKGKGVILVTAHFGNFPLMMFKMCQEGYKTSGIMRQMRDKRVERFFSEARNRLGIGTIYSQPRKTCVEESLKVLRNNELLSIQLDQNFGTGGVFVDFFGMKAATATGPVVLALRTQAAILPTFIIHNPDGTYRIVFEPEYKLKRADTYQQTVLINIQALTSIIESYIRRYPAEWGWIHRRWKSRPN